MVPLRPMLIPVLCLLAALCAGCDEANDRPAQITPDGSGFTTVRRANGKESVVRNGSKASGEYDRIHGTVVTSNGDLAFAAKSGNSWSVIRGKKKVGESCDYVAGLTAGSSGSVAYVAKMGGKWTVMRDGVAVGDSYEYVNGPVYSPDGKTLVFTAISEGKAFLVRDGIRQPGDYASAGTPVFGPDGKSVFFVTGAEGNRTVVKDGLPITGIYDQIDVWTVSPDGNSVALLVKQNWEHFLGKGRVLIDAKFPHFEGVTPPVFAPDGRTVAFAALLENGRWQIYRDGLPEGGEIEARTLSQLVFAPQGRSIACAAKRGDRWYVLKAGKAATDGFELILHLRSDAARGMLVFSALVGGKVRTMEVGW
jgi:WD40 repeat protein